ncbi:MAG: hypothetical protein ACI3VN_05000 [Candidatus Onthomonas sp.]
MELNVRDDRKIVEVWLTNEEQRDENLQARLKPLCQAYKEKKYTVAVFLSGSEDLTQRTSDLLCYNRKRLARLEAERVRRKQERAR